MKVYIAGSFIDQKALRTPAAKLWELGHEITGSWLNEVSRSPLLSSHEFKRQIAIKDIAQYLRAGITLRAKVVTE